jgi:hypothetical protein
MNPADFGSLRSFNPPNSETAETSETSSSEPPLGKTSETSETCPGEGAYLCARPKVGLAINCLSNIVTEELACDLVADVVSLLNSGKTYY